MTLLSLVVACLVIVLVLWLVKTYMPAPWQTPTLAIVVVLAIIFLIVSFWPAAANIKVK